MKQNNTKNAITLLSFGFKYGVPNSNYYFDISFLQNPARKEKWGFFSIVDDEMKRFVLDQEGAINFINKVEPLIYFLSSVDQNQIFAFGCNAGRHRSKVVVDELAHRLENLGVEVNVRHRDLE